jgi:hypothetical protein
VFQALLFAPLETETQQNIFNSRIQGLSLDMDMDMDMDMNLVNQIISPRSAVPKRKQVSPLSAMVMAHGNGIGGVNAGSVGKDDEDDERAIAVLEAAACAAAAEITATNTPVTASSKTKKNASSGKAKGGQRQRQQQEDKKTAPVSVARANVKQEGATKDVSAAPAAQGSAPKHNIGDALFTPLFSIMPVSWRSIFVSAPASTSASAPLLPPLLWRCLCPSSSSSFLCINRCAILGLSLPLPLPLGFPISSLAVSQPDCDTSFGVVSNELFCHLGL